MKLHSPRPTAHLSLARRTPIPRLQEKLSSGVSYVIPTESRQVGVDGLPVLPHLVIRPPGLREVGGPPVEAMLAAVQSQARGRQLRH